MPGGLIQLQARGAMDEFYTSANPDILFFKAIYRKFSHFAQELIELDDNNTDNSLRDANQIFTLKYKIPRNGNLINRILVELELPSIYSDDTDKFQWIRRIGEYMIHEARIISDNNFVFHRLTPEYIHVYHETHLNEGAKSAYYDSIGHVPEMYDPESVYGTYPDTSANKATGKRPSIPKRRIILSLPFWFCQHNGCALPLVATQLNSLYLEIDMKPLTHLYTVIGTSGTRERPTIGSYPLSTYTNATSGSTLQSVGVNVYANYIFLDTNLQYQFAVNSHQYLMKQLQIYQNDTGVRQGGLFKANLKDINMPITQFFFMLRRKDNNTTNQWSNFTLWEYDGRNLKDVTAPDFTASDYNNLFDLVGGSFSEHILTPDIITHTELRLNGNSFYKQLPIEFFKVNRFLNNKNDGSSDEMAGIYNFSFGLDNDKYQPSGVCNFSILNASQKEMFLTFKNVSGMTRTGATAANFTSEYEAIFLFENLNIIEFQGGMVGVKYVN